MFKATTLFFISSALFAEAALRGSTNTQRMLTSTTIVGECTVENFVAALGSTATLASYLKTRSSTADMQMALAIKCAAALDPEIDLSDTTGKGPQFLKNFLDGGTTWNNNHEDAAGNYDLAVDAAIINTVYKNDAKSKVFSTPDGGTSAKYPQYFSNFYRADKECPLGVIQCCYTDSRLTSSPFNGNADVCALDMAEASKSNHIKARSITYYDTDASSPNQAYCTGFAYENGSFDDTVKYNTLFHMAMKTNLYDKGLVKNIPGAPLCGCADEMPIVDNTECIKAVEGYTIDPNGEISVNISWTGCGTDLPSYYDTLNRKKAEKKFVHSKIVGSGQCSAAAESFMNDQMLIKTSR